MVQLGAANTAKMQGYDNPAPGIYHVMVNAVDQSFSESDSVIVDFSVLGGTTGSSQANPLGSEVDKQYREYYSVSEAASPRLYRLAVATKVKSYEEVKAAEDQGVGMDVDFKLCVGRQLIIELEPDTYEKDGETKNKVSMSYAGMWSVDDPSKQAVPKNQEALAIAMGAAPAQPAAAPVQQQAADPPAAAPPAAPAAAQQPAQQAPPQPAQDAYAAAGL